MNHSISALAPVPDLQLTPMETFLAAVHPDGPVIFCIWWKSPSQEGWRHFPCTPRGRHDASTLALSLSAHADVYVSMGAFAAPPAGRGKSDEVVRLHALWAEIDLAGSGHKLKDGEVLPEDSTAVQLLNGVEPFPSLIIFSGGGLHLYWTLNSPLDTASPEAKEAARRILDGWLEHIRQQFRYTDPSGVSRPFKVDAVSDLARVLRVVGTANHKLAVPRLVQAIWPKDLAGLARYNVTDFALPTRHAAEEIPAVPSVGYVPRIRRHVRAIDNFLAVIRSRKFHVQRKPGRNGYLIQCPGPHHGSKGDRHPSLDVDVADDRILLKCWVGCPVAEILRVLGLERSDLFDLGNSIGTRTFTIEDMPIYSPQPWVAQLQEQYRQNLSATLLEDASRQLGLLPNGLLRLGLGYRPADAVHVAGCWTWPMLAPDGQVLGIRLRDRVTGQKTTVKDTHSGLFVPQELDASGQLLITEGPTDCGAALDLGYAAIGRASCSSCGQHIVDFVGKHPSASVVIVADRDEHQAGLDGAVQLACQLVTVVPDVWVILPPGNYKDLRDWLHGGASRMDVDERIRQTKPVTTGIV